MNVKQTFEKSGIKFERAEIEHLPSTYITLEDKEMALKFNKLIDTLEDLEDVQSVFSNGDIAESLFDELKF